MFNSPLLMAGSRNTRFLSGVLNNVDMRELFGFPSRAGIYAVFIREGCVVTGFSTGSWPNGTILKLYNRGYILGFGGDGGDAGIPGSLNGKDGGNGQPALTLNYPLDIYMLLGQGYIWGGGGGGGGGSAVTSSGIVFTGSGGGGGVSGGAGGSGQPAGQDATTGISAVFGFGGLGVSNGGDGGYWGQPGSSGTGATPGSGGNSGASIKRNNLTATFKEDSFAALKNAEQIIGALA